MTDNQENEHEYISEPYKVNLCVNEIKILESNIENEQCEIKYESEEMILKILL